MISMREKPQLPRMSGNEREKIGKALTLPALLFFVALMVLQLAGFDFHLGLEGPAITLMLAINAYTLHTYKKPLIPHAVFLLPVAALIASLTERYGIQGALWCFPATLFFCFTLSFRIALACILVLATIAGATLHRNGDPAVFAFAIALVVTVCILSVALQRMRSVQQHLHKISITDPDTEIFNQHYIEPQLSSLLESSRKNHAPVSLLQFHIGFVNKFKDVSSLAAKNAIARDIVMLFKKRLRTTDIIFRMSTEELLVALPDTVEEDAINVAEQLRKLVELAPTLQPHTLFLSIGVSQLEKDETLAEWMNATDETLLAAKQAGGNQALPRSKVSPIDELGASIVQALHTSQSRKEI